MKKLSILIAFIVIAFSVSAQSGRERGLVIRPEVGLGMFSVGTFENVCSINTFIAPGFGYKNENVFLKNKGTSGTSYNLMANVGINLNTRLYIGGGAGLYGNGSSTSLALYANPRIYLSDKKFSFFFDIKAGYLMGLSGKSFDGDEDFYIKNGLLDKTNYYYDGSSFHTTEDYSKFLTVKENQLRAKGYYFSLGFGFEVNRSSFGIALDLFNTNLQTTIENHYYYFTDDDAHSGSESDLPIAYNNETKTYDDSNKLGLSFAIKYGYSIF